MFLEEKGRQGAQITKVEQEFSSALKDVIYHNAAILSS